MKRIPFVLALCLFLSNSKTAISNPRLCAIAVSVSGANRLEGQLVGDFDPKSTATLTGRVDDKEITIYVVQVPANVLLSSQDIAKRLAVGITSSTIGITNPTPVVMQSRLLGRVVRLVASASVVVVGFLSGRYFAPMLGPPDATVFGTIAGVWGAAVSWQQFSQYFQSHLTMDNPRAHIQVDNFVDGVAEVKEGNAGEDVALILSHDDTTSVINHLMREFKLKLRVAGSTNTPTNP